MKKRILLADDRTIVRQGVRMLLDAEPDMEVAGEAVDGKDAVRLAQELKPDLVVMDVTMPVMNGIEATRRLKEVMPSLPVLVLTMHDEPEFVFAMLDAGADGYVLKETTAKELASAIRAVLDGESVLYPSIARQVLNEAVRGRRQDRIDNPLTPREIEILRLVARGLTNREIAEALVVSVKTVETHRAHIMEKLDLHDRVDLVKYALRAGLIGLQDV